MSATPPIQDTTEYISGFQVTPNIEHEPFGISVCDPDSTKTHDPMQSSSRLLDSQDEAGSSEAAQVSLAQCNSSSSIFKIEHQDAINRSTPNLHANSVIHVPNAVAPGECDPTSIRHHNKLHHHDSTTRRSICSLHRHHSDHQPLRPPRTRTPRNTKKVRRSASAVDPQHQKRPHLNVKVRRSVSVVVGKHLVPPRTSKSMASSSRCSSTRTVSSYVSVSEIVKCELGLKEVPGLTPKEARRRRVVCAVVVVSVSILVLCVVLVVVTLLLSPAVDEVLRKGNEEIYRSMSAGASSSSPPPEDSVVANSTTPPSGNPG